MSHGVQALKRKMQGPCSQVVKNFTAVVAEQTVGAGPAQVRDLGVHRWPEASSVVKELLDESFPGSSPPLPHSLESPDAGPTPYSAGRRRHLAAHWRAAGAAHTQLVQPWWALGCLRGTPAATPLRHHNSLSPHPPKHSPVLCQLYH